MKLRTLPVLLAVVALTVTGCSSGTGTINADDAKKAGCTPVAAGKASNAVEVTGDLGAEVTAKFETPLAVTKTEKTINIMGDGDLLKDGDSVNFQLNVFDAKDGKNLGTETSTLTIDKDAVYEGWIDAISCMPLGSRSTTVLQAKSIFGEAGNTDLGIEAEATLVVVVDALDLIPSRAEGKETALPEGFPEVTLADNGEPTVTLPDGFTPSAKLASATTIEGDGTEVKKGDTVSVQYLGFNQKTGETFDSSWTRGTPMTQSLDSLIAGFGDGLVGKKVGSQVVILIPSAEAYGEDTEKTGKAQFGDIGFVVDILHTEPAAAATE
ncbi:FKBP-type peptidyl-prolyl cis-trans isomerase [Klugiella xanthotipulae]|uniref:peptidylprolyl isomerase n=1 Tax=Klugiella xanthotipulae TaxID=244735 RepID=A0A543I4Q0_9MICO|nr:FKBP-type peptidyl-prolyl cis-trans isomerase [Klugiella xanthotipulae]TQM65537.1 peptidylprolyl isomerase [Klugiella xanthotipulae]